MVDVDRRMTGLNKAHMAGLRRLSARASAPSTPTTTSTPTPTLSGLQSFTTLATKVTSHLLTSNIKVLPGLTDSEFAKLEAEFNFTFPPDLRAILSSGLPSGPGFPDWRAKSTLKSNLALPIASVSFQIVKSGLWSKTWGVRPTSPEQALKLARASLRRAPVLIPIFNHCYIPSTPCLAGNPIFFVDENHIFCCGYDLCDFFERESLFQTSKPESLKKQSSVRTASEINKVSVSSSSTSSSSTRSSLNNGSRTPRWIEFWTEACICIRSSPASSSVSTTSPGRFSKSGSESDSGHIPDSVAGSGQVSDPRTGLESGRVEEKWVDGHVREMGKVLREGGRVGGRRLTWRRLLTCQLSGFFDSEMVMLDEQSVFDALLLKADRLRRAGWGAEEVAEVLGFDGEREGKRRRRREVKMSPELVEKIGKLVDRSRFRNEGRAMGCRIRVNFGGGFVIIGKVGV